MLDLVQLDFLLFLHGMFALGSKLLAFGDDLPWICIVAFGLCPFREFDFVKKLRVTGVLLICLWHGMLGFAAVDLGLRSTFEFLEPSKLYPN